MATPRFPPVKSLRPRTPRSMSGNLEDGQLITMRRNSGKVRVINYDNMLEEAENAKVDPLNLKSWSTFLMNNKVQSKLLLTLSALGAAAYWYLSKSSPESPPMLALPSPDMVTQQQLLLAKQQLLEAFRQVWNGFKATKKSVKKSPKKSVKKSVKKSRKAKKSAKKSPKKH